MKENNIAVLLSTYNGEKFIKKQLDSLILQSLNFDLFIRDDGSGDETLKILNLYARKFQKGTFNLEVGSNIGVIKSFEFLMNKIQGISKYDWIAFCDQDDIWHPNKLERAISKLQEHNSNMPLLYHSDLDLINTSDNSMGTTFWNKMHLFPNRGKSLNKMLCQPFVTGCTMVINRNLLSAIRIFPDGAKMHDWWISLYAICKGNIISDYSPSIGYRQHENNVIGSTGFTKKRILATISNFRNYKKSWKRENNERLNQAEVFLNQYRNELNENQIEILEKFIKTRNNNFLRRKKIQFQYGFFQHSILRLVSSLLFF